MDNGLEFFITDALLEVTPPLFLISVPYPFLPPMVHIR